MTQDQFKFRVEALFAYKFKDALCSEDVDELLRNAVEKALSKFEKIKNIEIGATQVIPDAIAIVKCVPSKTVNTFNVFDFMRWKGEFEGGYMIPFRTQFYFLPEERKVILMWNNPCYIEYVADPTTLNIEDLTPQYVQWAIKYGLASVKEKEGIMGKGATLDALPFTLNYDDLMSQGIEEKKELETELEDMYFGLFTGKA